MNRAELICYILRIVPDKLYIKLRYRSRFGKRIDLKNPKTYNEKLQWLKLNYRDSEYPLLVDKYEVKKIIAERIGDDFIIPTIGVWTRFDDIDFEKLPNQFVLKCTHDSGGLYICKDKDYFDEGKAKYILETSLKRNFYYISREWPYKSVVPRIIAEEYMEDSATNELRDYKFFCFDGVPKAMFIATDRGKDEETKFDFFDMDFNHLEFTNGHPNADILPQKPKQFELMKTLAAKLSSGMPEVRIDFYEVNGKVFFGEYTFFHWGGFMPFKPEMWDEIFGSWIELPVK